VAARFPLRLHLHLSASAVHDQQQQRRQQREQEEEQEQHPEEQQQQEEEGQEKYRHRRRRRRSPLQETLLRDLKTNTAFRWRGICSQRHHADDHARERAPWGKKRRRSTTPQDEHQM